MKHLRTKILLGFIIILVLLAGLGGISYITVKNSNQHAERMISDDLEMLVASQNLRQNIADRISAVRGYLLYDTSTHRMNYLNLAEEGAQLEKEFLAASSHLDNQKTITDLMNQIKEWSALIDEDILPTFSQGELEKAQVGLEQKAEPLSVQIMYRLNELSKENQENMNISGQQIMNNGKQVEHIIVIVITVSVILGIIIAILSANSIAKPITRVANRLEQVAAGDLSSDNLKTKAKNEIGKLIHASNLMVTNLRQLVSNVNQSSEQIAASAEELTASAEQTSNATQQIASSTEQMAAGAEAQLNSVNETSATIQQMSERIRDIASNSELVSSLAKNASTASKNGFKTVDEVVEQMNTIEKTVKETSQVIESLGERSNEIGKIVTMITTISDQTSLLALNAAIEAARAGEAGRGFAVVADEVRKLAEQSNESAQQITKLIRSIQEETTNAVKQMQEGTAKAAEGRLKTNELTTVFHTIEEAVKDVETKVEEVSSAAEQMASGSEQMVDAVNVVKTAAEENAQASQENSAASQEQLAMMEEISSSAQSLSQLADDMRNMVKTFKLNKEKTGKHPANTKKDRKFSFKPKLAKKPAKLKA